MMARHTTFNADVSVGNTFRLRGAFRITLFSDYRVDVEVSLHIPHTTQRADFPHWAVQLKSPTTNSRLWVSEARPVGIFSVVNESWPTISCLSDSVFQESGATPKEHAGKTR